MADKCIDILDFFESFGNNPTDEHLRTIEKWIEDSNENKEILKDYYKLSWALLYLQKEKKFNTEKALEKVKIMIRKNDS